MLHWNCSVLSEWTSLVWALIPFVDLYDLPQIWHKYGRGTFPSLPWISFTWIFKESIDENLMIFSIENELIYKCCDWLWATHFRSHLSHEISFCDPVCTRSCFATKKFVVNALPQYWHVNRLSLRILWKEICCLWKINKTLNSVHSIQQELIISNLKSDDRVNTLSHIWHLESEPTQLNWNEVVKWFDRNVYLNDSGSKWYRTWSFIFRLVSNLKLQHLR